MPPAPSFIEISLRFDGEIRALHEFNTQLGRHADDFDQERWVDLLNSTKAALGLLSTTGGSTGLAAGATPSTREAVDNELTKDISAILRDPTHPKYDRARALYAWIIKLIGRPPSHGALLRRGLLSNLTTSFEVLTGHLIREYYRRFPEALSEEMKLTLAELRESGTMEAAEGLLVQREIDMLLFKPLDELLGHVLKRFSLPAELLNPHKMTLQEIFLRRNLFVHNQGVVNRHYLAKVPQSLFPEGLPKEGAVLPLTTEYLAEAIDRVFVSGVLLLQATWLHWDPNDKEKAVAVLIHHIYESLRESRFEAVKALAAFGYDIRRVPDILRKVIIVNHAIALRETGDQEKMKEVMKKSDWSSASLRFKVAVDILEGRFEDALASIRKALAVQEVTVYDLKEWPLFSPFRSMPAFIELLG